MDMASHLASLVLLGFRCQWLAWRPRQPTILFPPIAGLLLGPPTGLLRPEKMFGRRNRGCRTGGPPGPGWRITRLVGTSSGTETDENMQGVERASAR